MRRIVRRRHLLSELAVRLGADTDLAAAFERTPGKVARDLGIEPADVAELLEDLAALPFDPGALGTSSVTAMLARAEALDGAEHLDRIERIVVVMLENRSFDHMLGYLSLPAPLGGRDRPDVDGLDAARTNPDASGVAVPIRRLTDGVLLDNPGHSASAVRAQISNGAMDGFVVQYGAVLANSDPNRPHERPEAIMGYHTASTVPVYDFLAEQFTVCDRWHSAIPGPTWPNRMFLYAGRANGKTGNGAGSLATYHAYAPGMPVDLVVHRLEQAGATWGVYRGSPMPWMAFFPSFRELDGHRRHVHAYREFDGHCRRGTLPQVVFIDPNTNLAGNEPHRNNDDQAPSDVARGQELVGEVYETLRTSGLLDSTLLVVLYDEHGGFPDHVPPPPVPSYARTPPDAFQTLGVRVPALVVSAYVEPSSVCHTVLDHTSVLHTILLRFTDGTPLGARCAVAPNLGALLTRSTARPLPSAATAVDLAKAARSSRRGNPDPSTAVAADLVAMLVRG